MATEGKRVEFGETPKGFVVMVEKVSFLDDGKRAPSVFEVRHGVRTVLESTNEKAATDAAKAIVAAAG